MYKRQEQGSPLLAITKQQQAGLQAYLNEQGINAQVEIAMTYGNPSMQSAVKNLLKNGVERMIVLPLYCLLYTSISTLPFGLTVKFVVVVFPAVTLSAVTLDAVTLL